MRLPPITTVLPSPAGQRALDVQVQLSAVATETGTLALSAVASQGGARWKVEFDVRGSN